MHSTLQFKPNSSSHSALPPRRRRALAVAGLLTAALALGGCATGTAAGGTGAGQDAGVARLALGTKATYPGAPANQELAAPPAGFEPVLVEHVARHGSRLLSSKKYDDLILQLWELARDADALTETGAKLGPVVEEITAAHEELGYGSLSGLGEREHLDMAARVQDRMEPLFAAAAKDGTAITITTSGVDRAVESAKSFAAGLAAAQTGLEAVIGAPVADPETLYFHDSDEDYNAYIEDDPQLAQTLDAVESNPETEEVARTVLEKLFAPDFLDTLDSGAIDLVDRGDGDKHLESGVDAAMYLYELFVIAPGMAAEHPIEFEEFLSPDDALKLSIVSESEDFYEKGPGMKGNDVTYSMAGVLLADMLDAVAGVRTGQTTQAADFRFAHAEEIIPLAALLQLPGSTQQQDPQALFSHANNEWRGAEVAPMGANIQWDVFADADNNVLVRMLYNEKVIPFAHGCTPVESGSTFYSDTELARCLSPLMD
ncbi:histidine-type phosphatase [Specibacter sp. NPDC057265]|uniref:histidine-type phosphatase n=1 Tax=Specibacter sp. NPDC057265 TaxID=3346075 RepID=UPI00363E820E